MKNTKKYLSTGLALAIALFTAVQVTAMEDRKMRDVSELENPNENRALTAYQSDFVWEMLNSAEKSMEKNRKSLQKPENKNNKEFFEAMIEKQKKRAKACQDILFGFKPYTDAEITDLLK